MGVNVVLKDEWNHEMERLGDSGNDLAHLLPGYANRSYQCLWGIDRYTNTVFNGLQCAALLEDLGRLRRVARTPEEIAAIDAVSRLAAKCSKGVHLYLWFLGD